MMIGTTLGQAASVALAPVLTRLYHGGGIRLSERLHGGTRHTGGDRRARAGARDSPRGVRVRTGEPDGRSAASRSASRPAWSAWSCGCCRRKRWTRYWFGPLDAHRYLVPLGLACLGGYYVMVAAATCAGLFADIARTRITQGIGGPLSQIALGWLGAGTHGLAIGFIIGQTSGFFLLLSRMVLDTAGSARRDILVEACGTSSRRYSHFPLFASWTRVIDMAGSGTVLYLLFSAYYSTEIVGFMFLGERVIARPLLMVSSSLLQVFAGEAGRIGATRSGRLAPPVLAGGAGPVAVRAGVDRAGESGGGVGGADAVRRALARRGPVLACVEPGLSGSRGAASGFDHVAVVASAGAGGGVAGDAPDVLVAAAVMAHEFGLPAIDAVWICSAVQAAACARDAGDHGDLHPPACATATNAAFTSEGPRAA